MIIMIKCIFMIGDLVAELAGSIVCVSNNAAVFVEICTGNKTGPQGDSHQRTWQQKRPVMLQKNPTLIKHSPPLSISLRFFVLYLMVYSPISYCHPWDFVSPHTVLSSLFSVASSVHTGRLLSLLLFGKFKA